jgi:hypothetical protein
VQSVLVQEQALQAANNRVLDLEDQLRAVEDGERPRGSRSGSFLGGYRGGQRDDEPRSSVPQVGARATPSAYESRSPWSQGAPQPQPQPQQAQPPQQAPAPSGGGFMRSALTTAAGVAGGMLVADSIRNMLGGAHASPSSHSESKEGGSAADDRYVDEKDNDPGTYDADSNDPGNDPGGDGGDGGEIEI